jgi:hypothetical protein
MRSSLASLTLGTFLAATSSLLADGPETEKLKERVAALEAVTLRHEDQIKAIRASVDSNTAAVADLARRINTHQDRINVHDRRHDDSDDKINTVVTKDNSTPTGYRLRLLGNMQESTDLRKEFELSSKRRVLIINDTGREQFLDINGTRWRVLRNRRSYAPVAGHTLTLQRPDLPGWRRVVSNDWDGEPNGGGFQICYDYQENNVVRCPNGSGGSPSNPPNTTPPTVPLRDSQVGN